MITLKNKKALMPMSILFLVIATLLLVTISIFAFDSKQNKIDDAIGSGKDITNVYTKAEALDFTLKNIIAKIQNSENPIDSFKAELEKYRDSKGNYLILELQQVASQLDGEHIVSAKNIYFDITFREVTGEKGLLYTIVYSHKFEYKAD